jgi:two-component system sensor histidine kinase KdpD
VRIESPDEDESRADPEAYQRIEDYQRLARDLGAHVVILKDKKIADALIQFAQRENISHVIFGQSARTRLDILLRGSVINRFLSEARDTTVQVVPMNRKK